MTNPTKLSAAPHVIAQCQAAAHALSGSQQPQPAAAGGKK